MPVRAGKLNKPVQLQTVTRTEDKFGGFTPGWADVRNPYWVSIEPLRGQELVENRQRFPEVSYRVEGRYESGIKAQTHRLKYGDRILHIEHVINPMERSETLEFLCSESHAEPEQQA